MMKITINHHYGITECNYHYLTILTQEPILINQRISTIINERNVNIDNTKYSTIKKIFIIKHILIYINPY
jgi:hypothetical protein